MRHIDSNESLYMFRPSDCQMPADSSPPVMANDNCFLSLEETDHCYNIVTELVQYIIGRTFWFITQIVASLIKGKHSESLFCKRNDLFLPPIPEFRESMEE